MGNLKLSEDILREVEKKQEEAIKKITAEQIKRNAALKKNSSISVNEEDKEEIR